MNSFSNLFSPKKKIFKLFEESIRRKDPELLQGGLSMAFKTKIDSDYIPYISQLLPETWHEEHEELVNIIYLDKLKDDVFTESLYQIAIKPKLYRSYDDETESTLRKCVHAFKLIDSDKAKYYIEELKKTGNPNVRSILEMYGDDLSNMPIPEQLVIEYLPNIGFKVDQIVINWGENRETVRAKLDNKHVNGDQTIKLSDDENLEVRRDFYHYLKIPKDHFTLSYDIREEKEILMYMDIHGGIKIKILDHLLEFNTPTKAIIDKLGSGNNYREIDDGAYFFPDLKIVVSNSESCGGDGDGLASFYCSANVDHLENY